MKTYQNYTRLTQGGRPVYYNETTGRTISQESYEQLFLKEEGVAPRYSVPSEPRKTAASEPVRKEGLAELNSNLKSLFAGNDWESNVKRELVTFGLSTQRGRKIWADGVTTTAMLGMAGGGSVLREAVKFGLLDAGGKLFETGDVKEAAREGAEGFAEMLALGALCKIPRRVWAGAAGAAGAVAIPTGAASAARGVRTALENEVPAGGVRYGNYQTEPWQDTLGTGRNRVPSVKVQQASKGGDNRFDMSRNFLATDKVPESIFGIPVVSRKEDYTAEDLEFFRTHPEAGGYYDLGDANEEMVPAGGEEVPVRASEGAGKVYGLRNDGKTFKGSGWLGELKTSDGGVATEYSTQSEAVKVDGRRIDFPSLVPTLTPEEVKTMTDDVIPNHKAVPEGIMQKAVDHALLRIGQGASVWANDGNPPAADRPAYMAQRAIADVIPFIKEHEGFRAKAYKCSAGHWTVGYGQTEINGRAVKPGDTIDEPTAAKWLERRVKDNAIHMYRNYKWSRDLNAGALAAAYDIAYNLGVAALGERKSPTLTRDMKTAKDKDSIIWRELGTYVNVGGKPLKGLVNRRNDAEKAWRY